MIKSEKEYQAILERVEELLSNAENIENPEAKGFIELNILSDLVAAYEEVNFPILAPTLADAIKLRMHERGLTQKAVADFLGVSTSRISEYLNGRSEPTLKIAREISKKLDIEASIVLGV
jgi:HTH-type transcriptional regulator/antitoxin HigA